MYGCSGFCRAQRTEGLKGSKFGFDVKLNARVLLLVDGINVGKLCVEQFRIAHNVADAQAVPGRLCMCEERMEVGSRGYKKSEALGLAGTQRECVGEGSEFRAQRERGKEEESKVQRDREEKGEGTARVARTRQMEDTHHAHKNSRDTAGQVTLRSCCSILFPALISFRSAALVSPITHLAGVGRSDALAGCADLAIATLDFGQAVEVLVQVKDHMRAIRQEQAILPASNVRALCSVVFNFGKEAGQVHNQAVAQNIDAGWASNAAV